MAEIEQTKTTTLEDLELVVETFDEARGLEINEVIGDFVPETVKGVEKGIKAGEVAGTDPGLPVAQEAFSTVFARSGIKDSSQVFT